MNTMNSMKKNIVPAYIGAAISIAALALVWFTDPVLGLDGDGMHMLAVFCLCLLLWIFHPIPAEMTALLLMILPTALGIVSWKVSFSGWTSSTTWFLFGGLVIGRLVSVSGLDKRFTLNLLKRFGGDRLSVWKVTGTIMLIACLCALIIPSGTVLALILGAQIFPLVELYGLDRKSNVAKILMLTVPIVVLLCGNHSLSGSSHNLILLGSLEDAGYGVTWLGWLLALLPDTIFVCVVLLLSYKLTLKPEKTELENGKETIQKQLDELGKMSRDEKKATVLFCAALILWITNFATGIHVATVALVIAFIAVLPKVGVLNFRETMQKINWPIIIFVAAVLGFPTMMDEVNINEAFTRVFQWLGGVFHGKWGFLVLVWLISQLTAWLGLSIGAPLLFMPFLFPIAEGLGFPALYAALLQGYMQPTVLYYHAPAPLVVASYGAYTQTDYAKYQLVVIFAKIVFTPVLFFLWWPFLSGIGLL